MKAFLALGCGTGCYRDILLPPLKDDQILIKISYCGICGTDYALYSGNSSFINNGQATYPIRLGHEWSGTVSKVGSGVDDLTPGDRIVGDNYVSCGECEPCRKGDYNNCNGRSHVGTINPCWPGAFAEYIIMPRRHVYRIADNIPLIEAALSEPLSIAYGGIKKMDITPLSIVVVIGTGCIGMSAAALALYSGAGKVYMVGRDSRKLDIALRLGVSGVIDNNASLPEQQLRYLTGGRDADFVLECSGAPATVMQSVRMAGQKGKIALIGFYEQKLSDVDIDQVVSKELTLTGIMGEYGNTRAVLGIMEKRDLRLSQIITSIVDFDSCESAFTPVKGTPMIKTMVRMNRQVCEYEEGCNYRQAAAP